MKKTTLDLTHCMTVADLRRALQGIPHHTPIGLALGPSPDLTKLVAIRMDGECLVFEHDPHETSLRFESEGEDE